MTKIFAPGPLVPRPLVTVLLASSILSLPAMAQDNAPAAQDQPEPEETTQVLPPPVGVIRQEPAPLTFAGGRAAENAVRQSGDAFGTVVGREAVGLYNAELVRGFSPLRAGNVRLDDLYFDTVIEPTDRTSGATNILVGPSALGSVFPAPSGIVDFAFRTPGTEFAASTLVGVTTFGEVRAEVDMALPIDDRLSIGLGTTVEFLREGDGRHDDRYELAISANWRPTDNLQFRPFLSAAYTPFDDITPIYVPGGNFLPPRLPRRARINPRWSFRDDIEINGGMITDWEISPGWDFRMGVFNSSTTNWNDGEFLVEDLQPDGTGENVIIRDPGLYFTSLSGEARLSRTIVDGPRVHRIVFNMRGRDALRRFDGSDEINLGRANIFEQIRVPEPLNYEFDFQQRDEVKQWFTGLTYLGRWEGLGEIDVGIQYTDFSKRIGFVNEVPDEIDVQRLLYNVNAAIELAPRLALYGGYITGLEESGIAPGNAANRNEALPAIPTEQVDLGLRWRLTDDLSVIAGVFQLTSPYFSIDDLNVFRELGELRNRGFESSIAGLVTQELSINVGLLLLDPEVRGEAVDAGISGPRAVGGLARRIEASGDWRPGFLPGISFDMAVSHRSPEMATVNNLVEIPTRTLVTLGGRHFFSVAGNEAMLRVQVENLFDTQGFELVDAGAYQLIWPRRVLAYLTVDF